MHHLKSLAVLPMPFLPRHPARIAATGKSLPCFGMSDSQIGEYVGVSQPFVGKYRKELEEAGALKTVISRTGRDGRTTNTANSD